MSSFNVNNMRIAKAVLGNVCTKQLNNQQCIQGPPGPQGDPGPQGTPGDTLSFGNVAIVDAVYGNDATASVSGSPFLTIEAAIAAVTSGKTIWIFPGNYTLQNGITIPNGVSLRGISLQTTKINMNVTNSATMITMGENCRVEDLTMTLTCTGTTDNVVLKGIVFSGTSSQTSKLSTSVLTVDNSTMNSTLTSTVTGVEFSGTGSLNSSVFSFNSLKGSTINVYSNGKGNKRGILVSGTNQASTRDLNIFVSLPPDTTSTGSYVGVETADTNNTGSIQLRSTTCGVVYPAAGQLYKASDILQTNPITIADPTYLASAGIQIGPGTDLVTKSAGEKGFSTYVYPTTIYYGLKGFVHDAHTPGYCWPGTQEIKNNTFPDRDPIAAYYRVQHPLLISGLSCSVSQAPGNGYNITLTVCVTPSGQVTPIDTAFTVTISDTNKEGNFYNSSYRCGTGDRIHLRLTYTGNNANNAHDITAQIDTF